MQPPRSRAQLFGGAGLAVLLAGALCWALYLFVASGEHHSFTAGAKPPSHVQLRGGETYRIGIHGGVPAELRRGVTPDRLRCSVTLPGFAPTELAITPEKVGTKATDQIASFIAPYKGRVSITCEHLGAVYVDNTEADPAGVLLVLATILLTIGAPLLLSGVRMFRAEIRRTSVPSGAGRVDPPAEGSL